MTKVKKALTYFLKCKNTTIHFTALFFLYQKHLHMLHRVKKKHQFHIARMDYGSQVVDFHDQVVDLETPT